jgi:hypothetical protein
LGDISSVAGIDRLCNYALCQLGIAFSLVDAGINLAYVDLLEPLFWGI